MLLLLLIPISARFFPHLASLSGVMGDPPWPLFFFSLRHDPLISQSLALWDGFTLGCDGDKTLT